MSVVRFNSLFTAAFMLCSLGLISPAMAEAIEAIESRSALDSITPASATATSATSASATATLASATSTSATATPVSATPANSRAAAIAQIQPQSVRPVTAIEAAVTRDVTATGAIGSPSNPVMTAPVNVSPALGLGLNDLAANSPTTAIGTLQGQVTSISQLSDVQPTDWAFQALQSLVERYGCIAGYPDGTYRGNRALTRYEFAAGLNACLDRINELLASTTADLATQEDLATLQRLQEEFAAELATLRGRVDSLEARTAELEANQFSTTTVLRGNIWFNVTQAFPAGEILAERSLAAPTSAFAPPTRGEEGRPSRVSREDTQLTFSYYAWLTLNTSFSGKDALVAQLVVGNGNSPANQLVSSGFFNSWGTPFLDQTGVPTAGNFGIRELYYSFPVNEDIQIDVGPRLNYYRYFDANRFTFFLTGTSSYNSTGSTLLNAIDRGSGAVVRWQIADPLKLTVAYMAENTEFLNPTTFNTSSNPNDGLFNSSNTISAQLEYAPSRDFALRLIYARANLKPYNGFIGGSVGEPLPYGYADDGFGGTLNDSSSDTFAANFDWLLADWVGLFGRYSYATLDINPTNPARSGGDIRVQSFQVGLGFPDLGKQGALGVVSFVMPHDYLAGRRFLLSGGGDGGTQYELELSYRYPVNSNIAIVPAFYAIWNANNFDSNPPVYVGNVRLQFTF